MIIDDYKNTLALLSERSYLNCILCISVLAGSAFLGVLFYNYVNLNIMIDPIQFSIALFLTSPLIIWSILLCVLRSCACIEGLVYSEPLSVLEERTGRPKYSSAV